MRDYIEAKDGMVLTNGKGDYGEIIYYENGTDPDEYYPITREEYEAITNTDPENMATEQDYQNALRDMGVSV